MVPFEQKHGVAQSPEWSSRSLSAEVEKLCPDAAPLLAAYSAVSSRLNPTGLDLIKDLALDLPSSEQGRVAALLLRQLRLSGAEIPENFDTALLRALKSDGGPVPARESAAIALQGTTNATVLARLLEGASIPAPEPEVLLALRLCRHPQVTAQLLKRAEEAQGDDRVLFRWAAAFAQPYYDFSKGVGKELSRESAESAHVFKVYDGLPVDRGFRRDFQVSLAAVPFRRGESALFGEDVATVTSFAGGARRATAAELPNEFLQMLPDAHRPDRVIGLVLEPEGQPVVFASTGEFPRTPLQVMVLLSNLYSAAVRVLPPLDDEAPQVADVLDRPLPSQPNYKNGFFAEKIALLIDERSSSLLSEQLNGVLEHSRSISASRISREDIALGDLFTVLRDPGELRGVRHAAAILVRFLKLAPPFYKQPLEQHLLELIGDRTLSRYSRHVAAIALQDSNDESIAQRLCLLMHEPDVGNFAAVAIRGTTAVNLPRFYEPVITSTDPEIRMRGYISAMFILNDALHRTLLRRVMLTKFVVENEEKLLWRTVRAMFPAVDRIWNTRHVDSWLNVARSFNPLNALFDAMNSPLVRKSPWVFQTLSELPLCSKLYEQQGDDYFVAATHDGTLPLNVHAAGFNGDKRVVIAMTPSFGMAQYSVPPTLPVSHHIMGIVALMLKRVVNQEAEQNLD